MATSLIKKVFLPLKSAIPIPVMTDNLTNHEGIACAYCPQAYKFGFSDGESFRLSQWLSRVKDAINQSHEGGHELIALPLPTIP
jgi:hypothetical protein